MLGAQIAQERLQKSDTISRIRKLPLGHFSLNAQISLTHPTDLVDQLFYLLLQLIALALRGTEQMDNLIQHAVDGSGNQGNLIAPGDSCARSYGLPRYDGPTCIQDKEA